MDIAFEGPLDLEKVLPLSLIKAHCKIDDLPGITDEQIELYREAACEAAEKYTAVRWFRRVKITQEVVSPKYRGLAQAAIARITVELDSTPVDGIVHVYGTADAPLFWFDGQTLPAVKQPIYQTIMLPPGATRFEMSNDLMFYSMSGSFNCNERENGGQIRQQGATVTYIAGIKDAKSIPAGVKLGCLKYIAWSIQNPGDEFIPMVIRQVGVTTISNDPVVSSGALDEWRRHRRSIAK